MTETLHANIFFIIASVGVVIFTILTCLILYQVLKIVKSIRKMTSRVESGSEVIAEDLSELRKNFNPANIFRFLRNLAYFTRGPRNRNKETDDQY